MKNSLIILVFCFIGCSSFAQKWRIEKANALYEELAYADAIVEYEKLANNGTDSSSIAKNIADSYLKTGNYQKAEPWLYRMTRTHGSNTENISNYIKVLKANQKYAEADIWMKEYERKTGAKSTEEKLSATTLVEKLKENSDDWIISNLDINTPESDFSPAIVDGKLVFVSARSNKAGIQFKHTWNNKPFLNLYMSEETDTGTYVLPMEIKGKINSKYHEGPITASRDGNTLFFTRNNFLNGKVQKSQSGINNLKLYSAVKGEENNWDGITEMPFNSNEYSVGHPAISSDGTTLYFTSDMSGGHGGTDIYKSVKIGEQWTVPVNMGDKINSSGNEMFPFVNKEDELFFASNGHDGLGGLDIFSINLKMEDDVPENLGIPVNSSLDDFGMVFNEGDTSGYFSSNRTGGKGNDDIYYFQKLNTTLLLSGEITDKESQSILKNGKVVLLDVWNKPLDSVVVDESGKYSFKVDPDKIYIIDGYMEGYKKKSESITTIGKKDDITLDFPLEKEIIINLYGSILDAKSKKPIDGVKVTLTNLNSKKMILDTVSSIKGEFKETTDEIKIGEDINFQITLNKEGYLGKTNRFTVKLVEPKDINVNEYLKGISMDKIAVGADIGKMIDVNPIYFDVNKSNIRPDAATELDKIVEAMEQNPTIKIELGSHTDSRGSDKYNLSLSDKRAKASADYIISKGVDKFRIYGKGYGEKKLINKCKNGVKCSTKMHQVNRRTEFKIVNF